MTNTDPLKRKPIPYGYAVRFALSWHQGGWKKCAGMPKCEQCRDIHRLREKAERAQKGMRERDLEYAG